MDKTSQIFDTNINMSHANLNIIEYDFVGKPVKRNTYKIDCSCPYQTHKFCTANSEQVFWVCDLGAWGPRGPGGPGKGDQEKPKTTTGSNHQAQNGVTETKSGTNF